MSKQSIAKHEQGYTDKAMLPVCMNCLHYHSEMKQVQGYYNIGELAEKNKSCKLGNFVVKKMSSCNKWTVKTKAA
jgi:hypothetical protein